MLIYQRVPWLFSPPGSTKMCQAAGHPLRVPVEHRLLARFHEALRGGQPSAGDAESKSLIPNKWRAKAKLKNHT